MQNPPASEREGAGPLALVARAQPGERPHNGQNTRMSGIDTATTNTSSGNPIRQ